MSACLTVKQVADRFGCSTPLIYQWVRSGLIGHLRLPGGSIRIRQVDIDAFEAKQWRAPDLHLPDTASPSTGQDITKSDGQKAGERDLYQLGQRIGLVQRSNLIA